MVTTPIREVSSDLKNQSRDQMKPMVEAESKFSRSVIVYVTVTGLGLVLACDDCSGLTRLC
jgi:hypothetical protein